MIKNTKKSRTDINDKEKSQKANDKEPLRAKNDRKRKDAIMKRHIAFIKLICNFFRVLDKHHFM
jgi:hypothetical protein